MHSRWLVPPLSLLVTVPAVPRLVGSSHRVPRAATKHKPSHVVALASKGPHLRSSLRNRPPHPSHVVAFADKIIPYLSFTLVLFCFDAFFFMLIACGRECFARRLRNGAARGDSTFFQHVRRPPSPRHLYLLRQRTLSLVPKGSVGGCQTSACVVGANKR
jgi:hypothetical protein